MGPRIHSLSFQRPRSYEKKVLFVPSFFYLLGLHIREGGGGLRGPKHDLFLQLFFPPSHVSRFSLNLSLVD